MPVNYGSGDLGDVTLTSNTTMKPMASYQNLTINSGVTLTVPNGGVLQVADTLTLEGTISVQNRTGSGGGGRGGEAGGALFLMARNAQGSGVIRANGSNGNGSNSYRYNYGGGNWNADGLPPTLAGAKDNIITTGSSGGQNASQNITGSGGTTGDSASSRDLLTVWLDEWIVPSSKVSSLPMAKILPGGGGDGGNGARRANGSRGAGGGAGGAFGGLGGSGANGGNSSITYGHDGGGGGGSGGLVAIISESLSETIQVEASGAQGGHCGEPGNGAKGGSGGGGGGGVVVVITPDKQTPTYTVSGGQPGNGNRRGNAGQPGVFSHIPMSVIE